MTTAKEVMAKFVGGYCVARTLDGVVKKFVTALTPERLEAEAALVLYRNAAEEASASFQEYVRALGSDDEIEYTVARVGSRQNFNPLDTEWHDGHRYELMWVSARQLEPKLLTDFFPKRLRRKGSKQVVTGATA